MRVSSNGHSVSSSTSLWSYRLERRVGAINSRSNCTLPNRIILLECTSRLNLLIGHTGAVAENALGEKGTVQLKPNRSSTGGRQQGNKGSRQEEQQKNCLEKETGAVCVS